ncbi:unnamed protein product [Microthlaspi erraticum]|uniref:Uncharacterized protein n=1 Tax=Microthlaspi erraticum TaxID=1685480 RepID=A0A6D2IRR7_9BRAS|nr:unnamed protein product [Microthlaspi erraticum]
MAMLGRMILPRQRPRHARQEENRPHRPRNIGTDRPYRSIREANAPSADFVRPRTLADQIARSTKTAIGPNLSAKSKLDKLNRGAGTYDSAPIRPHGSSTTIQKVVNLGRKLFKRTFSSKPVVKDEFYFSMLLRKNTPSLSDAHKLERKAEDEKNLGNGARGKADDLMAKASTLPPGHEQDR